MLGLIFADHITVILEEFARAGGGGSGGGGGDGAGGILVLIGMIGYFPTYGIGRLLRMGQYDTKLWPILQVVGWIVASILALGILSLLFVIPSVVLALYIVLPIAIGTILGMGGGLYSWFSKIRQSGKVFKALRAAEAKDYNWNEKRLQKYAEGIFYAFQKDWSSFNADSMRKYMSPRYRNHIYLMLHALNDAHRINRVLNPKITKALITHATDSDDNNKDEFIIGFSAHAKDQLIDTRSNTLLHQDRNTFTEYWKFVRNGNDWLLDGIEQYTKDWMRTRADIEAFATRQNMYYSADWGWLLLPKDGYIFSKGKFGISDINNHVIGYVGNNILTQLYTYEPVHLQNSRGASTDQYLVIQSTVPKTYGRILVKRRSKLINWPVAGLTRIKMEWGEFNDMYDVYASDLERVTSFELLNPAFMAHLRDLPFEVNIEVVDNTVYLFTKANMTLDNYGALYTILLKAHKEMKL